MQNITLALITIIRKRKAGKYNSNHIRVVLTLDSSKANKSHNPEVISFLVQEHSPCPIKLIWDCAKIRQRVAGPFFLQSDNSPLQYSDLASIIHLLA